MLNQQSDSIVMGLTLWPTKGNKSYEITGYLKQKVKNEHMHLSLSHRARSILKCDVSVKLKHSFKIVNFWTFPFATSQKIFLFRKEMTLIIHIVIIKLDTKRDLLCFSLYSSTASEPSQIRFRRRVILAHMEIKTHPHFLLN